MLARFEQLGFSHASLKSVLMSWTGRIRKLGGSVAGWLPLPALELLCDPPVVAPCYHVVTDRTPVHVKHLFANRNIPAFRSELDRLLRRYTPISLQELKAGHFSGRRLFLSFDDGLREIHDIVAPICLAKGIPATFFVNSAFLDNRELFFRHKASILCEACQARESGSVLAALGELETVRKRIGSGEVEPKSFFLSLRFSDRGVLDECASRLGIDFREYLKNEQPYLTSDQLNKLILQGFSVGAHSVDHPLYSELPLDEQLRQTRQCLLDLSSYIQPGPKSFAFPFVSDGVSPEFFERVFQEDIADLIFCIGGIAAQPRAGIIRRFPVEDPKNLAIHDALKKHLRSAARLHFGSAWTGN